MRTSSRPRPVFHPCVLTTRGGIGLELVRIIHSAVRAQVVIRIQASPVGHKGPAEEDDAANPAKRRRSMLARCGPLANSLEELAGVKREEDHSSILIDMQQVSRPAIAQGRKGAPW